MKKTFLCVFAPFGNTALKCVFSLLPDLRWSLKPTECDSGRKDFDKFSKFGLTSFPSKFPLKHSNVHPGGSDIQQVGEAGNAQILLRVTRFQPAGHPAQQPRLFVFFTALFFQHCKVFLAAMRGLGLQDSNVADILIRCCNFFRHFFFGKKLPILC